MIPETPSTSPPEGAALAATHPPVPPPATPPVSYSINELVTASGFDRRTIVFYIQQGILPRVGRRGPGTRYPADCLARLRFVRGVKELQNTGRVLGASLREMGAVLQRTPPGRIANLLEAGLPADGVEALFATSSPPPTAAQHAAAGAMPATSSGTAPSPASPPMAMPPSGLPGYSAPAGERRSYGLADAGIRRRPAGEAPAETQPGSPEGGASPIADEAHPTPSSLQPGSSGTAATDSGELGELLRHLELRAGMSRRRAGPGASEQWTEIPITGRVYLSIRGLAEDDAPAAEAVVRALKKAIRT